MKKLLVMPAIMCFIACNIHAMQQNPKELIEQISIGSIEGVLRVIRSGANLNAPNQDGDTPIMIAARFYTWDPTEDLSNNICTYAYITKLLRDAGADLRVRNNAGEAVFDILNRVPLNNFTKAFFLDSQWRSDQEQKKYDEDFPTLDEALKVKKNKRRG